MRYVTLRLERRACSRVTLHTGIRLLTNDVVCSGAIMSATIDVPDTLFRAVVASTYQTVCARVRRAGLRCASAADLLRRACGRRSAAFPSAPAWA